jgi:GT2 family glycosyltransferase
MAGAAFVLYVVPTFNRARELPRTLQSIADQRWPTSQMAILVIDNSSTDDTPAVLADLTKRLPCKLEHLRKAPEGPTVARNIGLRRGVDGYVALIDSDVELDADWTAATVAALEADPSLAQVGGKLLFAHDSTLLNSYGGEAGWLGLAWDRAEGHPADSVTHPAEVLWINTSAVMVRPGPVLAVGGFDEAFFYGYEEPDLGLRLAIAGWRSMVVPQARALHHTGSEIGVSNPLFVLHYTKNRIRMGIKALGPGLLPVFLLTSLVYGLLDAILHRPRASRFRALIWNVVHIRDTWRQRRLAQNARTLPDRRMLHLISRRAFPPRRLKGLRRRPVSGLSIVATLDDDRVSAKRTVP